VKQSCDRQATFVSCSQLVVAGRIATDMRTTQAVTQASA
jgi:hypothetical protein